MPIIHVYAIDAAWNSILVCRHLGETGDLSDYWRDDNSINTQRSTNSYPKSRASAIAIAYFNLKALL